MPPTQALLINGLPPNKRSSADPNPAESSRTVFGPVFVFMMFISALFFVPFAFVPLLPLLYWGDVTLFRRCTDVYQGLWMRFVSAMLELGAETKIIVSGDKLHQDDRCLIIANHRTRLDWLFLWPFVGRFGRIENLKIILKEPLRYIPGAGWAMQMLAFIFLRRKWEHDKQPMLDLLTYFSQSEYPLQLLMFPEGTDLSPSNIAKSHDFSRANSLSYYNYVLHPRTTGFVASVQQLRGNLDAVYDVTMAYDGHMVTSETHVMKGRFPSVIHVHVQRFNASALPTHDDKLAEWCKERFKAKEHMLSQFYSGDHALHGNEINALHGIEGRPQRYPLIIAFWLSFLAIVSYALYQYALVRWYFVISCVALHWFGKRGAWYCATEAARGLHSKVHYHAPQVHSSAAAVPQH